MYICILVYVLAQKLERILIKFYHLTRFLPFKLFNTKPPQLPIKKNVNLKLHQYRIASTLIALNID